MHHQTTWPASEPGDVNRAGVWRARRRAPGPTCHPGQRACAFRRPALRPSARRRHAARDGGDGRRPPVQRVTDGDGRASSSRRATRDARTGGTCDDIGVERIRRAGAGNCRSARLASRGGPSNASVSHATDVNTTRAVRPGRD